MPIDGSCHCKNISFSLVWDARILELPVRACGCSFCTARDAVWVSNPGGELNITIKDHALVSEYAFGTRTAEFQICKTCGVVPVVTSTIDDEVYAVVNANTLDSFDQSRLSRSSANFDGEDTDSRLGRRKQNWIGQVRFI